MRMSARMTDSPAAIENSVIPVVTLEMMMLARICIGGARRLLREQDAVVRLSGESCDLLVDQFPGSIPLNHPDVDVLYDVPSIRVDLDRSAPALPGLAFYCRQRRCGVTLS